MKYLKLYQTLLKSYDICIIVEPITSDSCEGNENKNINLFENLAEELHLNFMTIPKSYGGGYPITVISKFEMKFYNDTNQVLLIDHKIILIPVHFIDEDFSIYFHSKIKERFPNIPKFYYEKEKELMEKWNNDLVTISFMKRKEYLFELLEIINILYMEKNKCLIISGDFNEPSCFDYILQKKEKIHLKWMISKILTTNYPFHDVANELKCNNINTYFEKNEPNLRIDFILYMNMKPLLYNVHKMLKISDHRPVVSYFIYPSL